MKKYFYGLLVIIAVLIGAVYLIPITFLIWKVLWGAAIVGAFIAGVWVANLFKKQ